MAWCAHDSLDHRDHTRAIEQFLLLSVFLEDARKRKALYGAFAVVTCRRLDRNVCWVVSFSIFDCEEARIRRAGWTQAQEDVKKRTRGSRWRFHSHVVCPGSRCELRDSMLQCSELIFRKCGSRACTSTLLSRRCQSNGDVTSLHVE
jgi:hypothetical protein